LQHNTNDSRPTLIQLGDLGERCKRPQWGLRRSPSRQTIWCILESKSAALVAAVFVDFPKNNCNFLHENKRDIVKRVQFLPGQRPMRCFSPGQSPPLPYGSRSLWTARLQRSPIGRVNSFRSWSSHLFRGRTTRCTTKSTCHTGDDGRWAANYRRCRKCS